jgi:hypothetical protein
MQEGTLTADSMPVLREGFDNDKALASRGNDLLYRLYRARRLVAHFESHSSGYNVVHA